MPNSILLNDGTSVLLKNGGVDEITLANTGSLFQNDGTSLITQNDGVSSFILHPDPYIPFPIPATRSFGVAAEFETFNDHLESSSPISTDLYTVTYWAQLKSSFTTGAAQRGVWSIENVAGTSYVINITTFNADTIEAHDSTQGGFQFTKTDTAGDGWYFVAETNDLINGPATHMYWMLDGALSMSMSTGNNHGSIPGTTLMYIGSDSAGGQNENWIGGINRMRIFSASLSPSQVLLEAQSATPVATGSLWASYPLAPGAGFLLDASGNGRHLTNPSAAGAWRTIQGPTIGDPSGLAAALVGSVSGQASLVGALAGGSAAALAGSIIGQASEVGNLSTQIVMLGTFSGTGTAAGSLSSAIKLVGAILGQAFETGNLTTGISLAGALSGQASLTGNLAGGSAALQGAVSGNTSLLGSLTSLIQLSGQALGQASLAGDLSTHGAAAGLVGSILGQASLVGALFTDSVLHGHTRGRSYTETFGSTSPVFGTRPALPLDGQSYSGLQSIEVVVSAPPGAILLGSGSLRLWLYDPRLDPSDPRWVSLPMGDLPVSGTGSRDQGFIPFVLGIPDEARFKWVPDGVSFVSGSGGVTVLQVGSESDFSEP